MEPVEPHPPHQPLTSWLDSLDLTPDTAPPSSPAADTVLFVDVRGGDGSRCRAVRNRFPARAGRVVLQESRAVLATASGMEMEREGVECVEADCGEVQGVVDAQAYYFCRVLSGYRDDAAIHVLQMHLPALRNNPLSRLYIEESIVPRGEGEVAGTGAEGAGEGAVGGEGERREGESKHPRSEEKWRWLLDQAGMEVVDIKKLSEQGDAVVVAKRRVHDQWR